MKRLWIEADAIISSYIASVNTNIARVMAVLNRSRPAFISNQWVGPSLNRQTDISQPRYHAHTRWPRPRQAARLAALERNWPSVDIHNPKSSPDLNPWPWLSIHLQASYGVVICTRTKLKFKGRSVQQIEWKRTDRQTIPIALSSRLTRLVLNRYRTTPIATLLNTNISFPSSLIPIQSQISFIDISSCFH